MKKRVTALFISDVHLGSRGCNAKELLAVLKDHSPEVLFIVGDFIDGWLLKKRHYWKQDYTNVIRKILSLNKKGTRVVYVTGNHDDFLREYGQMNFGGIEIVDEIVWNEYLITHGDLYDGVVSLKWLGVLGSVGYEIAITVDRFIKRLGVKKSLSKWLKNNVKNAIKFITAFEDQLVYQAKQRKCKGVICGHIHMPESKDIEGIHYLNCGDWIENNSYIIYTENNFYVKKYESNHSKKV